MTLPPPALAAPVVLLGAAAVWDLARRTIPDAFPLLLLAWAVASRLLGYQAPEWDSLLLGLGTGLVLGFLLFTAGWFGGGDGKLLAGLGAVLGPLGLLAVLPWIALFGGVFAFIAHRRGHEEVVYGPAIALGYAVAIMV